MVRKGTVKKFYCKKIFYDNGGYYFINSHSLEQQIKSKRTRMSVKNLVNVIQKCSKKVKYLKI